jgi:CheY-like chemotaxis protein
MTESSMHIGDSPTVLVIDDEPIIRRLILITLNTVGFRGLEAKNGPDAFFILKDVSPNIILLDVMMPYMNGYEVCRRLKSDPTTSHIPVILVTALTCLDSRKQGFAAGADGFISKPFSKSKLLSGIDKVFKKQIVK